MRLLAKQQREEIEALNRIYGELGRRVEADDRAAIRAEAIRQFTRRLDAKLANLQEGESLFVDYCIEIIRDNGRVRGGSGAERNMPEYIEWRKAVYERDGFACQECGATGALNAHHIKPWAHYPGLRFALENGITLCPVCHAKKHPHLRMID